MRDEQRATSYVTTRTKRATSGAAVRGVSVVDGLGVTRERGEPNKPMVPTAPTPPNEHPLGPLRRHIGRPLGSRGRQGLGCV
jgi:hypothetical protein